MIDFYTASTPNGWKVSIMLEELGVPYRVIPLHLDKKEQKDPRFLRINPNGRIPAIVDHEPEDFAVFESGAILLYLAEKYRRFIPQAPRERSRVVQWLMFQVAGIGPMMGQAYYFMNFAPEKIPYAIERYQNESRRLLGVLDEQLLSHEYLAGEYSIADMAVYPWVFGEKIGVALADYPHLVAWIQRMEERPAVRRGMGVPGEADYQNRGEIFAAPAAR